jgi:hypothetical protein
MIVNEWNDANRHMTDLPMSLAMAQFIVARTFPKYPPQVTWLATEPENKP